MQEKYSVMKIKLDGEDMYILWFSDIQDGVYTYYGTRNIPVFPDIDSLRKFCDSQRVPLSYDELTCYNLDMVRRWVDHPTEHGIKCDDFFHVWNIIHDILLSVDWLSDIENEFPCYYSLYDKLFWGAMMESKDKNNSRYYQGWDGNEIATLQGMFRKGIDCFRQNVSLYVHVN